MSLLDIDSSTDNRFCLHLCDFRICYSQTATTVTHHWVKFVEACDDSFDIFNSFALSISESLDVSFFSWNELMERWIQESDCYRMTFECFVKSLKVALLVRKNLIKSNFSFFNCVSTDHFAECSNSVSFKEHMLCTAKTDTFSTKFSCFLSISRCICVCSNFKCSELVSPFHNSTKFACDFSINSWDDTIIDVTC